MMKRLTFRVLGSHCVCTFSVGISFCFKFVSQSQNNRLCNVIVQVVELNEKNQSLKAATNAETGGLGVNIIIDTIACQPTQMVMKNMFIVSQVVVQVDRMTCAIS